MWLFFNADISFMAQERWYSFSVPTLYRHKIDHHFKFKYQRMVSWVIYMFYSGMVSFYLPFYTLNDITGGSSGLISIQGQQGIVACLIMTFTNWSIFFIFTTSFFKRYLTMAYRPMLIMFIVFLVWAQYGGDYSKGSVIEILFGSILSIPVIIVGTTLNVIPVYIARSFERVIFSPQYYCGPTNLPNFKAEYARFKAESLIQEEKKELLKEDE